MILRLTLGPHLCSMKTGRDIHIVSVPVGGRSDKMYPGAVFCYRRLPQCLCLVFGVDESFCSNLRYPENPAHFHRYQMRLLLVRDDYDLGQDSSRQMNKGNQMNR